MKTGAFVAGIIVMLIGAGSFYYIYSYRVQSQEYLGQILTALKLDEHNQNMLPYKVGAAAVGMLGIAILTYGAVARDSWAPTSAAKLVGGASWSPSAGQIFCRYCGKVRSLAGAVCTECGRPTTSTRSLSMKCGRCQAAMSDDSSFCSNCSKKF
jgi:hypothetical protein